MSIAESRREQLFPTLNAAQIDVARRFASGEPQWFAPGAVMMPLGARGVPAFLILSGAVQIVRRDGLGRETEIVLHGPGQITGEMSQLAGRASIAEGRAAAEGCEAVPFDAAHLRALLIGSAELGEILMRAFILRRTAIIADGSGGVIVLGHRETATLVRLQGFLGRNGYPHTALDAEADEEAATLVARFGLAAGDLPMVLLPDGTLLRHPSEIELAGRLGLSPDLDPAKVYDVAIVGAGPAGLATAVYGASEGLSVIVVDERAPGGQAGASARIENYLGFPTGISGQALAGRAFTQATKFGAEVGIPLRAARLDCSRGSDGTAPLAVVLDDERRIPARTVVIASGARYRKPAIDGLDAFEGAGVSYWASPVEAKLCAGEEVAVVGAGNSAGQAVAFLAPQVKTLHLVVRGNGLEASMSRYLIERIAALPNVVVHRRVEIAAIEGDAHGHMAGATFLDRDTGHHHRTPLRHLFLFIGADPNTGWLDGCVALDPKGFVLTGAALSDELRQPLETSVLGVFAAGDIRSGSTKRVAAGVGEGAAAVAQIHAVLGGARTNA